MTNENVPAGLIGQSVRVKVLDFFRNKTDPRTVKHGK